MDVEHLLIFISPIVTWLLYRRSEKAFVSMNIGIFIGVYLAASYKRLFLSATEWYVSIMAVTSSAISLTGIYRLISAIYLHLDAIHLILNVFALYIVGNIVEGLYRTFKTCCVFFSAGICANIASAVFLPTVRSAGGSAAVLGLFGVLIVEQMHGLTGLSHVDILAVGLLIVGAGLPNVNVLAHMVGFTVGVAYGHILGFRD